MNQDAFRGLLQTERSVSSRPSYTSRGSSLRRGAKPGPSKTCWNSKAISASGPAFKPRNVKKASETYRDRAEERRSGKEGDYAQVEAVLEEFEKRNADNEDRAAVDAQRRYLGGDSDHSILVKGLDFALLEQNKARLTSASSKQDDEALEEVFAQTASTSSAPTLKKRSRAEIIKELKGRRANEGELEKSNEGAILDKHPDSSKFRPIGFKPIGASSEDKVKRKKGKERSEPKKKKRKVEPYTTDAGEQAASKGSTMPLTTREHAASTSALDGPIRQSPDEDDFDIFADAGEYKGLEFGSEDDTDDGSGADQRTRPHPEPLVASPEDEPAQPRKGWFGDEAQPEAPEEVPPQAATGVNPSPTPKAEVDANEEQPGRLAPLSSSAMPSIHDFLVMDEVMEKEEKRKARKEKRKGKNKAS
ncbi:RED-like protein N-terminal region-domain-containing protein [Russula earlei]|uniref:RED-like protein N-terminal region-domain-containing protein n=1 Tax=Russula earlei TaxID=71964 RepID=A0ACC0U2K0_9AGAM|nr:RED-like protein N-terminal region-domain-containing protein [Russula earlei]